MGHSRLKNTEPELETAPQPAKICETAAEVQTTREKHSQLSQQDDSVSSATRGTEVHIPSTVGPAQPV